MGATEFPDKEHKKNTQFISITAHAFQFLNVHGEMLTHTVFQPFPMEIHHFEWIDEFFRIGNAGEKLYLHCVNIGESSCFWFYQNVNITPQKWICIE